MTHFHGVDDVGAGGGAAAGGGEERRAEPLTDRAADAAVFGVPRRAATGSRRG